MDIKSYLESIGWTVMESISDDKTSCLIFKQSTSNLCIVNILGTKDIYIGFAYTASEEQRAWWNHYITKIEKPDDKVFTRPVLTLTIGATKTKGSLYFLMTDADLTISKELQGQYLSNKLNFTDLLYARLLSIDPSSRMVS